MVLLERTLTEVYIHLISRPYKSTLHDLDSPQRVQFRQLPLHNQLRLDTQASTMSDDSSSIDKVASNEPKSTTVHDAAALDVAASLTAGINIQVDPIVAARVR